MKLDIHEILLEISKGIAVQKKLVHKIVNRHCFISNWSLRKTKRERKFDTTEIKIFVYTLLGKSILIKWKRNEKKLIFVVSSFFSFQRKLENWKTQNFTYKYHQNHISYNFLHIISAFGILQKFLPHIAISISFAMYLQRSLAPYQIR